MHWIDWAIMALPVLICGTIAVYSRRYVRSVADFMAGGRGAGRFLICTARSEMGTGAAVFVATFQRFVESGFTLNWFSNITVPFSLLLVTSGYVIYRYRQTRAMTLGQFFEIRYSRNFRLFAGVLGFFAGLLNFGIIPAVGARFMVAFLQLPQDVHFHLASLDFYIPTFLLLMAVFLTICVVMTTAAGQVSVLLTDCAEGMFSMVFFVLISVVLLLTVFKWSDTRQVLLATAPGRSLVNPFDTNKVPDFNITLILMGVFGMFYRTMAWQNAHAFHASAATPHEARMGNIIGGWRGFSGGVMIVLLSACAMTFFKMHPKEIEAALAPIKSEAVRDQMRSPVALTMMLPVGVKGALLAICVMGIIAGDGMHLHSWGSIFIQDVVVPLRQRHTRNQPMIVFVVLGLLWDAIGILTFNAGILPWITANIYPQANAHLMPPPGRVTQAITLISACIIWGLFGLFVFKLFARKVFREAPLTPKEHLSLLRWSIVGVAVWALIFGALFPQTKYVGFWWALTESVFVGGAGIAIVGGLYWRRGTAGGAWCAIFVGSGFALSGIGMQLYFENILGRPFYLNGVQIGFCASILATVTYIVVSLLTSRVPFDLDKMLHRGIYAVDGAQDVTPRGERRSRLFRIVTLGIDEQFSRSDRWITMGISSWHLLWFSVFAVGSVIYLVHPWSNAAWATYWLWSSIYLPLLIGVVTTIWFTWGCFHDMRSFFRRLRNEVVNDDDDGSVPAQDGTGNRRTASRQLITAPAVSDQFDPLQPAGADIETVGNYDRAAHLKRRRRD